MGEHARHSQSFFGGFVCRGIVSLLPVGVCHDGVSSYDVEGDILCGDACGCGDGDSAEDMVGVEACPFEDLHTAHRAADDAIELANAKMVDEAFLCAHHIPYGDNGECHRPWRAIVLEGLGACCSHTPSQGIATDDKIAFGIDGFVWADGFMPPSCFMCEGVCSCGMLVAAEGVAQEDGVAPLCVECSPCPIGDIDMGEGSATFEGEGCCACENLAFVVPH